MEGGFEPAHRALGLLLAVRHQPKKALEELDEAIKTASPTARAVRHKAWILATSLDDSVRDGKKAVECAELALQGRPGNSPNTGIRWPPPRPRPGNFKEAVEAAEKALQQARLVRGR